LAAFSLGSDTGGSIRQPASFCGVVGMKPTYGRVSRFGLVAFASSLDQIGPFTQNVEDCAHVMNALCGFDEKDSTSSQFEVPDFTTALKTDVAWLKIAVPKELMGAGIDPKVAEQIQNGLKLLEKRGATITEVEMPSFKHALSTYYLVATAEASANLARFDGVRFGFRNPQSKNLTEMFEASRSAGFGDEVKRRIMLGTYALSSGYYDAYYLKAQKVRTLIKQDFAKAYQKCDVLFTPTTPTVAFKFGEKTNDPLSMYLSDIATIPINLAGVPAMAMPCGTSKGLPVGLQIIGREFDEATIFKTAFAVEKSL
jgi:aspartyl-tRNA(Asn)/glutamyl-tRNA(Gln) amidotransferase subunit A